MNSMKVRQIVAEAALKARAEGRKQGLEEAREAVRNLRLSPGAELSSAAAHNSALAVAESEIRALKEKA